MSIERYRALVEQLSARLQASRPSVAGQSAIFLFNGSEFTLFHGGLLVPDSVVLYCDFGELPQQSREPILLRLLETNMYLFAQHTPAFTYSPARNRVVLMCRFGLAQADLESTLELMDFFAGMARRWSHDHFLFDSGLAC